MIKNTIILSVFVLFLLVLAGNRPAEAGQVIQCRDGTQNVGGYCDYIVPACPENTVFRGNSCQCESGQFDKGRCRSPSEVCQSQYGPSSYSFQNECLCKAGSVFNADHTACEIMN